MLLETDIKELVEDLKTRTDYPIFRAWSDVAHEKDRIVFSTIPTGIRTFLSLGNFIGKHEDDRYNYFGYIEDEIIKIACWITDRKGVDGRSVSQQVIWDLERYIKSNWDYVNIYKFDHSRLLNPFQKRQRGYELIFTYKTLNIWDDVPDEIPEGYGRIVRIEAQNLELYVERDD